MKERDLSDKNMRLASDAVTGVLDPPAEAAETKPTRSIRNAPRRGRSMTVRHFAASPMEDPGPNRQAEQFYLQKQIQQQTQMVFVLEDGSRIQGVVEWYDRHSIKVRGRSRTLIFKSAIKYLYKAGEVGMAPSE
ncbi:RNA chaperone Hfq [Acidicapsa dinghuensis]|uniref:RNA chaperone Hfq n=1 Tax=Acidicapsa dinghuensis TaxID=2218256 RepID=A0ABW1EL23_9BACT|nr:RNA chaperone Hfq [Acidicapsa dinghuensis]